MCRLWCSIGRLPLGMIMNRYFALHDDTPVQLHPWFHHIHIFDIYSLMKTNRYGCLATIRMCEEWLAVNLLSHLPDHPARWNSSHQTLFIILMKKQCFDQIARSPIVPDGFLGGVPTPLRYASKQKRIIICNLLMGGGDSKPNDVTTWKY